jgi:hypothetical protein
VCSLGQYGEWRRQRADHKALEAGMAIEIRGLIAAGTRDEGKRRNVPNQCPCHGHCLPRDNRPIHAYLPVL